MHLDSLNGTEKRVLRTVHKQGSITRQDIAAEFGVTKMQATNISKSLIEKDLLTEKAVSQGRRGQPARVLTLNPKGVYSIGVNFTANHIDFVLMNWTGKVEQQETLNIADANLEMIVSSVSHFTDDSVTKKRIPRKKVIGVGVSVPGDFTIDRQVIVPAYFPQFENVNLQDAFSRQLDYPVYIENDSNCASWGEAVYGTGKTDQNIIFINMGYGIGGGVIIQQRLYRGSHGNAGIFGTPFADIDAPRPSGSDLLKTLRNNDIPVAGFRDLEDLNLQTSSVLENWLKRAAEQLRQPLYVLARAFDPDALVIGGRLPVDYYEKLVNLIDNGSVYKEDWVQTTPQAVLKSTSLGASACVLGAASLCYEQLFFKLD